MTTLDPVQMLIDAGAIPASPYARVEPLPRSGADDAGARRRFPVAYGKRRFIPPPSEIAIAAVHLVQGGERPDLLAHAAYQQPLLQWRIGDGNAVIDLFEATDTIGARVVDSGAAGRGLTDEGHQMRSGLNLGVIVGPVPMPAPAEFVHAITRVKVDEGSGDAQSGFEITLRPAAAFAAAHAVPGQRRWWWRAADAGRR